MVYHLQRKCFLALFFFVGSALQTASAFVPSSPTSRAISNHKAARRPSTSVISASPSGNDGTDEGVATNSNDPSLASNVRRALLASSLAALSYNAVTLGATALGPLPAGYERVSPLQFIAALGDPDASSGGGAERWGLWPTDPGPRGLRLREYERIESGDASAPSWLDAGDFFLDENAIIMPQPEFPLPPGKYLVTGARAVTTGLTIDEKGNWKLDSGKLYDVTHLPCRAARYRPANGENGSPSAVRRSDFPVVPGGVMPNVPGTEKEIYSVLFIVGKQSA